MTSPVPLIANRQNLQHIVRPDQQAEFEDPQTSLYVELNPQGAVETVTFQDLLHAAWSLHRLRRMEVECDPADFVAYERISRYQGRAQRAYYKALKELRILQTNRALRARKIAPEELVAIPAITDINHLTKQTHSEVTAAAIDQAAHMLNLESSLFLRAATRKDDRALRL